MKSSYIRSESQPYFSTSSSGETTFPLDLLILAPALVTIPWLKRRLNGSSKSTTPISNKNLV